MIDVRDRKTDHINRARVKLELKRGARPALVVLLCIGIGLVLAGYVVSHVSPSALSGTYRAKFALDNASGITAGVNEVRFKGIPVGEITKLQIEHERPVITVKIRKTYGPIFRDVKAQLRPTTALQDMFLDIVDRGTASAGKVSAEDPIPASQTATPVPISEILDVFKPTQRVRLRELLDNLGNGMQDRGRSLRAIFVEAVPFLRVAGGISAQLADRAPMVARLVHNTAALTRELGQRETQLRTLVREGSSALGTLQDGSPDLDATLRELPPTLARIDSSFSAVRGVLGHVDGAVRSLYPVADRLPASLTALRTLSDEAAPAVRALKRPVTRLVPVARTLKPLSANLGDAVMTLLPQVPTLDKVTKGAAGCKKGIQGFFQWNTSISKFGDLRGPIPRGNVVIGAQSSSVLNDPNEYAPKACVPGQPVGGRVPTEKDKH
jgi:phospholipid/cholesterol/gamma-HCH transport system substrate-binding protein